MPTTLCGAQNLDYPDEYACTLPAGHGPVTADDANDDLAYDHAAPTAGAWWRTPTGAPTPTGVCRGRRRPNLAGFALLLVGLLSSELAYLLIANHGSNPLLLIPPVVAGTTGALHFTKREVARRTNGRASR